jgi:cytochrome b561
VRQPTSSPFSASTHWRYSALAISLHWLMGLWLVVMASLGWYMMAIEDDPGSDWYFNLHKSLGLIFLTLVAVRLVWRLLNPPARLPTTMPRWQVLLSGLTQFALYICMALIPLAGYLGASYSEHGVLLFGWPLPVWATSSHDNAEWFFDIHGTLVWVLIVLVAGHAAGALKHRFINKDSVFQRMWFKA